MHFKFPAAVALFGLLASSAMAVLAANVKRNNGGHPTPTSSACVPTGTAAILGFDIYELIKDILTVGIPSGRPFVVNTPLGKTLCLGSVA